MVSAVNEFLSSHLCHWLFTKLVTTANCYHMSESLNKDFYLLQSGERYYISNGFLVAVDYFLKGWPLFCVFKIKKLNTFYICISEHIYSPTPLIIILSILSSFLPNLEISSSIPFPSGVQFVLPS